jgi:integrase
VELIVERPAALDVCKAQVTGCVRVSDECGHREEHVAEFATTVRGLLGLRDWLAAHRVEQVVMGPPASRQPDVGDLRAAIDRRQTRFATTEQIEAMLGKLESPEDRALWATALYAGLRRGELTALHREDIDLATGEIRVERG